MAWLSHKALSNGWQTFSLSTSSKLSRLSME